MMTIHSRLTHFIRFYSLMLLLCPLIAQAQPSSGTVPIIEPSCDMTAGPSVVDVGVRTRGQMDAVADGMSPGMRSVTLNVVCEATREMKVRFSGASRHQQFLWGGAESVLRITVRQASVDGNAVQLQRLNLADNGIGEPAEQVGILPEEALITMKNGQPVAGNQLSMIVDIVAVFVGKDARPVERSQMEASLRMALQ